VNLALDFGNTRIKAGLFDRYQMLRSAAFATPAELLASDLIGPAKNVVICSVTSFHVPVMDSFSATRSVLLFKPDTPVPITNLYKSVLTLGSDRLAAAVGGFSLQPNRNLLSIDAGTCIKYNFVNAANAYLGGAIAPGIQMRLRAMNHFTSRLPLVELQLPVKLIGTNTPESLQSGAVVAAACEIDGMINRYRDAYPDLKVILTGGDAVHLSGLLKNSFFAHPNLVLLGLNVILEHHLAK